MLHTWDVDFARDLLKESGYKTNVIFRALPNGYGKLAVYVLVIEPSSYNPAKLEIQINGGRVSSEPLREYLDRPLIIGGMRVRVQQKSLVDFGD